MKNSIQILTTEAVELLKEMVATPSLSFEEEAVCGLISSFLTEKGISHSVAGNNIIAVNRNFSPEKKTLMLNAHVDTVPPNEEYALDPFRPDYEKVGKMLGKGKDEIVYGLGSNDDGASVVSLCAVFRHFYEMDLPVNLMLVLSCEEERSGPGGMTAVWKMLSGEDTGLQISSKGLADIPLVKPDWAIIGEPTGMRAATSERGLLVIDGEASGVAGHAARGDGINALYIAIDDIGTLRRHKFGKVSPVMGEVRMSVTQIEAGTAHNVIPDKCRFVVDIRPTEMYDNEEILNELQSVCRSRLTARNLKNRSSATCTGSPLLKSVNGLGIGMFSSPTTSDWMRVGCDAIKVGPGDSSRSHKRDEFVTVQEISDGILTYVALLDNFFNL